MDERRGAQALGAILIAAGILFLLGQLFDVDVGRYGWPLFVIVPGLLLIAFGVSQAPGPAAHTVVGGVIVTTVGLILLVQNMYDAYRTWAYAWALAGPTASGVGLALAGMLRRDPAETRRGLNTAGIGFVMFLAFAAFFEGVLHLSGRDFGAVGQVGFPLVLIVLGIVILVGRLGR